MLGELTLQVASPISRETHAGNRRVCISRSRQLDVFQQLVHVCFSGPPFFRVFLYVSSRTSAPPARTSPSFETSCPRRTSCTPKQCAQHASKRDATKQDHVCLGGWEIDPPPWEVGEMLGEGKVGRRCPGRGDGGKDRKDTRSMQYFIGRDRGSK
eukprot:scaffold64_cov338-Pavlova_lutheri.AAC.93